MGATQEHLKLLEHLEKKREELNKANEMDEDTAREIVTLTAWMSHLETLSARKTSPASCSFSMANGSKCNATGKSAHGFRRRTRQDVKRCPGIWKEVKRSVII